MANGGEHLPDVGDAEWETAQYRADLFRRILAAHDARQRSRLTVAAARELAISRSTIYRLLAKFRAAEVTSAVLPKRAGRKRGSRFLDRRREAIIAREITRFYLKPERPGLSHLVERVSARCHQESLPPPDWRTIRASVSP